MGTLTAASDEAAAVAAAEAAGLRAEVAQLRATAENVQRLEFPTKLPSSAYDLA